MRLAFALLALLALLAIGCGAPRAGVPGVPVPGVRERIVSSVPVDHAPVMPRRAPAPGEVRVGVVAGATPPVREATAPSEGQRRTPPWSGELFVGVGMPGGGVTSDGATGGWELVGGVTGAPSPRERAHDRDPMLAAPDRDLLGGYLQINGMISLRPISVGASFAVRAVEIPFAWDYGDCAGGPSCPIWNQKGAPVASEGLAWGGGGTLVLGFHPNPCMGLVIGTGIELLPSIATSRRGDVACDANGNCTGGMKPSAPTVGTSEFYRQYILGGDILLRTRWARAFLMLVYTTGDDPAGRVQARGGLEARF